MENKTRASEKNVTETLGRNFADRSVRGMRS